MKKTFSILLLTVLTISQVRALTDLIGTPYGTSVSYLLEQDIIGGYADDTFRPNNRINRAEFMKIIAGAFLSKSQISECDVSILKFSDIKFADWYIPYVCAGVNWGVINGYSDGTFHPERNISFAEGAKMLAKIELKTPQGDGNIWYEDYVKALEENSAIPTTITAFDQQLSRGEVAEMIYRLHAKVADLPQSTYASISGEPSASTSAPQITLNVKPAQDPNPNPMVQVPISHDSSEPLSMTSKDLARNTIPADMLSVVNMRREEEDLSPLSLNLQLSKAAQNHADDMIAQDYFDHTDKEGFNVSDRVAETGYFENAEHGWSVGENIAWGQDTVINVMRSWMNSSSHKGNILNEEFTEMGVGFACAANDTEHQKCKWVQVFATKYN